MANTQILLVEDEFIVAKDVQNRLQRMGYTVSGIAASGEESLRLAGELFPDLVLMDIMLKGTMDGIEASAQLRQRHQIPVVYLTAYSDDHTLQRAKITEPFGYLLKPYHERELYTTIEMALFKHRMERKLRETEQWLAATLRSIGDAVIAADSQGMMRLLNPRGEALTGWQAAQIGDKSLIEIFKLVDARGRELLPNPITQALVSGTRVVLPPNAVLLSREQRLVPITGTVAPIHDSEGTLAGLVLVFRETYPSPRE